MTIPSIIDVVRAWMRHEGITIHDTCAVYPLEGARETEALKELVELVIDAKETSSGLIASIKAQRWDNEVTAEVPNATIAHLRELSR